MIFLCGYKTCPGQGKRGPRPSYSSLYELMEHYVSYHRWGKYSQIYKIVERAMQQAHQRGL